MEFPLKIIVPCYNEAVRFQSETFLQYLHHNPEVSFLFVNDGSKDHTEDILQRLSAASGGQADYISLSRNSGKAEAIRQGVVYALRSGPCDIGFWDADLATPLDELDRFIKLLRENPHLRMICGARVCRLGTRIVRHWYRHYPGRVVATLISLILRLPIYDSQCGAKLFRSETAAHIFMDPFVSTWLFDVELIARIVGALGNSKSRDAIYELPLENWRDVAGSKIRVHYLPRIPLELLKIAYYYRQQLRKL